ncbi:MAG: histidine kinase dimerization/phosphoacceptor domain -containing protein [Spirochaetales bacterium]|uniref:Histidine kinase dimerization/phosphoacceptor domain -containing protein n=1 Tax=Candidatus Thalassospirochaeta sargassi TaxID=3119039 RepID=A0AAJ1IEI4_9SPIO|nr:histidine kinase dimerization/phosphoacceptor domain -containing protein [Spirochaetales bacterium]
MTGTELVTEKLDIILAISDSSERKQILTLLKEKALPYTTHCPETLKDFDEISRDHPIKLIIADFEFQNGSLVDWLALWPYPFILLVSPECQDRLDEILLDEANSFLLRRNDSRHVNFVPNMIRKVLSVDQSRSLQNSLIRISEKQYMNLVQILPDIIYVLDADGNFTFINNAIKTLGWEPIDLIGKHFSTLLFEEDVPKVSRNHILPNLRGKITGNDRAPKLFDERRTGSRMTRGLKLKLKRKSTIGGSISASLISYGEISSIGYTGFQFDEIEGLGTAGVIREDSQGNGMSTAEKNAVSIFNTKGALNHDEVMHLLNNKLQILSSLVSLKQNLTTEPQSAVALTEVQMQIYTLSLVYQNMVMIDNEVKISMKSYLDDIIKHLVSSYAGNPWIQQIDLHCTEINLDEDSAITLSLFVSEILTIFLKLEESIDRDNIPVSITFLENDGLAQIKIRTSEEIFNAYRELPKTEDPTLIVTTLVETLQGEIFTDRDSLTLFFNINNENL